VFNPQSLGRCSSTPGIFYAYREGGEDVSSSLFCDGLFEMLGLKSTLRGALEVCIVRKEYHL